MGRLGLPCEALPPDTEETAAADESPADLAVRLAAAKAEAVAALRPHAWVIGSDQVCSAGGRVLGKPGSRDGAIEQLGWLSGRTVDFHTAVAVLRKGGPCLRTADLTQVRFRHLHRDEILRYVDAEPALDCAGSFKCEGLGITLCESIHTQDPTALIGLPLIRLADLLRRAGFRLP